MAYFTTRTENGRHFLQIPGPSNVPDRVLRALDNPTMDHRGPDFGLLGKKVLEKLGPVFGTTQPVIIFPASGTGAWEAALVNTLSPGDTVLMCETGWFAHLWQELAGRLGLKPRLLETDWRRAADVPAIEAALRADKGHEIKAVCVVHNETSTGCTSRIDEVRRAMDAAGHPALLMVDTISSLGSVEFRHDAWGVDVTISGSQKGLMLPPGISFNAVSEKALRASETARLPRAYWDWKSMLASNATGYFPYTPATNMLYALDTALDLLMNEGLANVFARHERHAEATRRAVRAWGLEIQCEDPRHFSPVLTAVRVPEGHSANALRAAILERFDMSLGNGLGRLNDRVFRIGHLGALNDLSLLGTLGGVEMGLRVAGVPHDAGGVKAAMDLLSGNA
ncbi:pyridoxal-phosphate-dependent aminotransferase family protein [Roseomonas populi]|uniref:Aminotransferase class V-fold PLP-dependent enzyme n=1 Tax=Roseomonas populi TaxID=3121582 RepID=A0ABT1WZU8_9PROT|nr:aminotransferase class V-fold PLP-dependent enzyme [Roseomonas pecuniae]MCR0981373.1 aminotransferase class V-fold PLP-dependent enzyme [Roseomonas pecuniae]